MNASLITAVSFLGIAIVLLLVYMYTDKLTTTQFLVSFGLVMTISLVSMCVAYFYPAMTYINDYTHGPTGDPKEEEHKGCDQSPCDCSQYGPGWWKVTSKTGSCWCRNKKGFWRSCNPGTLEGICPLIH